MREVEWWGEPVPFLAHAHHALPRPVLQLIHAHPDVCAAVVMLNNTQGYNKTKLAVYMFFLLDSLIIIKVAVCRFHKIWSYVLLEYQTKNWKFFKIWVWPEINQRLWSFCGHFKIRSLSLNSIHKSMYVSHVTPTWCKAAILRREKRLKTRRSMPDIHPVLLR